MTTDPTPLDPKAPWQSRALIGAAVVALAQVARWLVPDLDLDTDALTEAALGLATLAGAALAWIGRWQATRPVRWTKPTAPPDPAP